MKLNRRDFGKSVALMAGAFGAALDKASPGDASTVKVGMTDWDAGDPCDPSAIARAKEAHLEGLQVSVGTRPDFMPLRDPALRRKYIELGKRYNITFNSVAAGRILNAIPLMSEPESAVYVIDALETAAALGAKNILMAFFSAGELRRKFGEDKFRNLSKGPFASYELNEKGVDRVVAALKQIAPRAENLGVIMGLENTLTAAQNLEIIERVGSGMLQVYYDVGNSTGNGYDVPSEIRLLGNDRICEIHLKDKKSELLGTPECEVDFTRAADACRDIGYDKWYVLETPGLENRFIEDTRYHVAFVKKTFAPRSDKAD